MDRCRREAIGTRPVTVPGPASKGERKRIGPVPLVVLNGQHVPQGACATTSSFVNHAVVVLTGQSSALAPAGTIYDPSYGATFSSEQAWEDGSLKDLALIYSDQTGAQFTKIVAHTNGVRQTFFH